MKSAQISFLAPLANQPGARAGLVGAGRLEFDGDSIRVVGTRGKKLVPGLIAGVVGTICMLAAIIGLLAVDLGRGTNAMKLTALIALVAGVVPGALVYNFLLARLPGAPVDTTVRRDALKIHRASRERIDLEAAQLGGRFSLKAADAASQALLAEQFAMAQTL